MSYIKIRFQLIIYGKTYLKYIFISVLPQVKVTHSVGNNNS